MAGAFLELEVTDERFRRLMADLARRMANMRPAFAEIGEIVYESVQRNFEESRAPDGTPWEPLAPSTAREKAARGRNVTDILIDTRTLMGSIHPEPHADHVKVGTNVIYAAVHQFGADFTAIRTRRRVRIPARPYLGVRDDDWPEIRDAVEHWLEVTA